jgi:Short repeat of unknown function (DUF308)
MPSTCDQSTPGMRYSLVRRSNLGALPRAARLPLGRGPNRLRFQIQWALVTGVFEIAAAVRLRKHVSGEWMLALSGVLSIAFGALIVIFPLAGALAIALWVGAYCLIFGAVLVALGFRLRHWSRRAISGASIAVPVR